MLVTITEEHPRSKLVRLVGHAFRRRHRGTGDYVVLDADTSDYTHCGPMYPMFRASVETRTIHAIVTHLENIC